MEANICFWLHRVVIAPTMLQWSIALVYKLGMMCFMLLHLYVESLQSCALAMVHMQNPKP